MTLKSRTTLARFTIAALAATAPLLTGCVRHENIPGPSPLEEASATDAAMERRNWEKSTAMYSNTATVANNTGFDYYAKRDLPLWLFGFADLPIFFVNTAVMPYSLFRTPPGVPVEYKAENVAPTSNGNPPLPPPPPGDQKAQEESREMTTETPKDAPPAAAPSAPAAAPSSPAPMETTTPPAPPAAPSEPVTPPPSEPRRMMETSPEPSSGPRPTEQTPVMNRPDSVLRNMTPTATAEPTTRPSGILAPTTSPSRTLNK